ncbi:MULTISPECIES: hypothetical protein [Methylococcus]|uniref:Lipoprotein n=1 Tax=Methylococcus capsulatus TaxID=414 RepID=A0ABZ2F3C2_METCP|nr:MULTISPECIES: hypothetical protein [Methylococcus]MDF9392799.1 hypothetical protein [Methylococcus capsulatus]
MRIPDLGWLSLSPLLAALLGCAASSEKVDTVEELLAAAGFKIFYAQSPREQANLDAIPQRQLVSHRVKDTVTYLYADNERCDCVYVGDQAAQDRLRRLAAEKTQADWQIEASEIRLDWTMNPAVWRGMYP